MARYDVYANEAGPGFLLDCQADLLAHLNTRFVVPLLPLDGAPMPAGRLNPLFEIEGARLMMATQFGAAVSVTELQRPVTNLAASEYIISNALDMLLNGF